MEPYKKGDIIEFYGSSYRYRVLLTMDQGATSDTVKGRIVEILGGCPVKMGYEGHFSTHCGNLKIDIMQDLEDKINNLISICSEKVI